MVIHRHDKVIDEWRGYYIKEGNVTFHWENKKCMQHFGWKPSEEDTIWRKALLK